MSDRPDLQPQRRFIASSRRVGRLTIDIRQIRGDGGVINPTLVIPISAKLLPLLHEQPIAVPQAHAELFLDGTAPLAGRQLGVRTLIQENAGSNGKRSCRAAGADDRIATVWLVGPPDRMPPLTAG